MMSQEQLDAIRDRWFPDLTETPADIDELEDWARNDVVALLDDLATLNTAYVDAVDTNSTQVEFWRATFNGLVEAAGPLIVAFDDPDTEEYDPAEVRAIFMQAVQEAARILAI